jgi:hypothetical protein
LMRSVPVWRNNSNTGQNILRKMKMRGSKPHFSYERSRLIIKLFMSLDRSTGG